MDEQDRDIVSHSALKRGFSATGRGLVAGGSWLGARISQALKTIDPDVHRHILQLPLLANSLFAKQDVEIKPGEPDGWPPLVFVHGLAGNPGNFLAMSCLFWLGGRKRSYRVNFSSDAGIAQLSQQLVDFVSEVCEVNHEPKVDLVAHSMGGVVARLALQELGLSEKVKNFVCLGVPHGGTYPARYGNTKTVRDLRPGSELIRRINSSHVPDTVKVACLWSKNDLFVLPPESACMDGALNVEMSPFTHYSYLLDPRSFEAVRYILEGKRYPFEVVATLEDDLDHVVNTDGSAH